MTATLTVQRDIAINAAEAAVANWDVIIIGAGPAGSCAACAAAAAGMRVLLLDKAVFPRNKVCGCCLAPAGQRALREAGLGAVLAEAGTIRKLRLHAGRRSTELPTARYAVISRQSLDSGLISHAAARGVTVLTGVAARIRGGDVAVTTVGRGRTEHTLRAKCIIAADGLSGTSLAEVPGSEWTIAPRSRMGCGLLLTRPPLPMGDDQIVMLTHRAGYLGLVHLPCGGIDAAAAICPIAAKRAGGPMPLLAEIIRQSGGDANVLDGVQLMGTGLLTRKRKVAIGNVLIAGDAAGYVEPFTGEGMSWAITTGLAAGQCAAQMVTENLPINAQFSPEAGQLWRATHRRLIGRRQMACGIVAALTQHSIVPRCIVTLANLWPAPVAHIASRLGGFHTAASSPPPNTGNLKPVPSAGSHSNTPAGAHL